MELINLHDAEALLKNQDGLEKAIFLCLSNVKKDKREMVAKKLSDEILLRMNVMQFTHDKFLSIHDAPENLIAATSRLMRELARFEKVFNDLGVSKNRFFSYVPDSFGSFKRAVSLLDKTLLVHKKLSTKLKGSHSYKGKIKGYDVCISICWAYERNVGKSPGCYNEDRISYSQDLMSGTPYERVCWIVAKAYNLDISWSSQKKAIKDYRGKQDVLSIQR